MSANIFFRQVKPAEKESLSCFAPSSFLATMMEAFGDMPLQLDQSNLDVLYGMSLLCGDGGGNPYQELIDAINKYHLIEVWPEF